MLRSVGLQPPSLSFKKSKIFFVLLGFIKKALKHGSALVPTFSFGEAFIYGKLFPNPRGSWIRSLQEYIVDKTRWPFPFFFGRGIFQYSFGMLPKRHPITVVSKFIYFRVD